MASALKLPVDIEDFRDIRRLGFYYVDKALFEGLHILQRSDTINMAK